jgi:ferritin heavy chain
MEVHASYVYLSMVSLPIQQLLKKAQTKILTKHLPGFAKYFRANSDEERDHGIKLINYQNMKGGKVVLQDINKPKKSEWGSALEAVEDAMDLERIVNEYFLALHKAAADDNDAQMTDFIKGKYIKE